MGLFFVVAFDLPIDVLAAFIMNSVIRVTSFLIEQSREGGMVVIFDSTSLSSLNW